jgi:dATP/dGTP diphosphohydrolase
VRKYDELETERIEMEKSKWKTKDSGKRESYASGMVRDTQEGKPRFDLLIPLDVPFDQQLLTRFAALMARGAVKYSDRNWEKGDSSAEIERAKSSAFRHLMQWLTGETDEDHCSAVMFNILVAETLTYKLQHKEINGNSQSDSNPREDGFNSKGSGSQTYCCQACSCF